MRAGHKKFTTLMAEVLVLSVTHSHGGFYTSACSSAFYALCAEALQQVNIKFSTGDEEIKIMECIGYRRVQPEPAVAVHNNGEGAPEQMIIYEKGHKKRAGQEKEGRPPPAPG